MYCDKSIFHKISFLDRNVISRQLVYFYFKLKLFLFLQLIFFKISSYYILRVSSDISLTLCQ